jgi:hypothetical protein
VAGAGAGLVSASPDRPAQPLAVIAHGPGNLDREQLLDLVAGQRDQPDGGGRRSAGRAIGRAAPRPARSVPAAAASTPSSRSVDRFSL